MRYFAGVDAGSRAVKIVLLDADGVVVERGAADQGAAQVPMIDALYARMLTEHNISPQSLGGVIATGYARNLVTMADTVRTEITCHARGVRHVVTEARSIIEVGGQDSKFLRLSPRGGVTDFSMNDRCAAGSGRFLETVAQRLQCSIDELGALSAASMSPAEITSTCVVFAETEIIGLLAAGCLPADIAAGVQGAVARRVAGLTMGRVDEPVVFTGGVALVPGMASLLAREIGCPVLVAPDPQFTGALGAALLARSGANSEL